VRVSCAAVSRLVLLIALTLLFTSPTHGAQTGKDKFNASLRFMRAHRSSPTLVARVNEPLRAQLESGRIALTVKFDHTLASAELDDYRRMGIEFYSFDGEIARTGTIYPVKAPWEAIDLMAARTEVLRLDGTWHPAVYPLLDLSGSEIEADLAHDRFDGLGFPMTGKGMRIADFDTGIDVFHPSFFYADGDTLDWIDVDGFGTFNPNYDCVDLNGNGTPETNELINYYDGWIYDPALVWGAASPSNVGNGYQAHWDWLYNDANRNRKRDFGPSAGYTELDPTFGELILLLLDENGNNTPDVGEKLVALGTSKVYATMNSDEIERLRGIDVIDSDYDTNGHGTAVSGILAGGTAHRHLFDGVAPDAEILMGYFFSDVPISVLIPWARSRGADAMLSSSTTSTAHPSMRRRSRSRIPRSFRSPRRATWEGATSTPLRQRRQADR
jgi:hypothetical protein